MATILRFPSSFARGPRNRIGTARRDRQTLLAALVERIGPLTDDENAGLRTLARDIDTSRVSWGTLMSYLDAEIDAPTWKRWLSAFGRTA